MLSGNKGEWSEIYTLLKLLSEGRLSAGDSRMNKIEDIYYPIIKIIRNEIVGTNEYITAGDLILITDGEREIKVPIKSFTENAKLLFKKIKLETSSFRFSEIESFLSEIRCTSLKAKSSQKTDIQIQIHDLKINRTIDLGFSIKSQLGGESTLLNAGKTTNFIYEIQNFNAIQDDISAINLISSKSKIKDRVLKIIEKGGILKFHKMENEIFQNNLTLIDSSLPELLSELLIANYTISGPTVFQLTETINHFNPLKYNQSFSHKFYEYKIKKFLVESALGMMPGKVWSGEYDATGGYLVVKNDGEIVCYNVYNRNEFEDYLFNNTKLETASSTRHEFGQIYYADGKLFFKLNLQVRFK